MVKFRFGIPAVTFLAWISLADASVTPPTGPLCLSPGGEDPARIGRLPESEKIFPFGIEDVISDPKASDTDMSSMDQKSRGIWDLPNTLNSNNYCGPTSAAIIARVIGKSPRLYQDAIHGVPPFSCGSDSGVIQQACSDRNSSDLPRSRYVAIKDFAVGMHTDRWSLAEYGSITDPKVISYFNGFFIPLISEIAGFKAAEIATFLGAGLIPGGLDAVGALVSGTTALTGATLGVLVDAWLINAIGLPGSPPWNYDQELRRRLNESLSSRSADFSIPSLSFKYSSIAPGSSELSTDRLLEQMKAHRSKEYSTGRLNAGSSGDPVEKYAYIGRSLTGLLYAGVEFDYNYDVWGVFLLDDIKDWGPSAITALHWVSIVGYDLTERSYPLILWDPTNGYDRVRLERVPKNRWFFEGASMLDGAMSIRRKSDGRLLSNKYEVISNAISVNFSLEGGSVDQCDAPRAPQYLSQRWESPDQLIFARNSKKSFAYTNGMRASARVRLKASVGSYFQSGSRRAAVQCGVKFRVKKDDVQVQELLSGLGAQGRAVEVLFDPQGIGYYTWSAATYCQGETTRSALTSEGPEVALPVFTGVRSGAHFVLLGTDSCRPTPSVPPAVPAIVGSVGSAGKTSANLAVSASSWDENCDVLGFDFEFSKDASTWFGTARDFVRPATGNPPEVGSPSLKVTAGVTQSIPLEAFSARDCSDLFKNVTLYWRVRAREASGGSGAVTAWSTPQRLVVRQQSSSAAACDSQMRNAMDNASLEQWKNFREIGLSGAIGGGLPTTPPVGGSGTGGAF